MLSETGNWWKNSVDRTKHVYIKWTHKPDLRINRMSKPKAVKAPPVPAPATIPDTAPEAGEDEAKRVRRQMGYQKQILTGNLTPKSTGKRTTLG
jgi:hypothetical protein